MSEPSTFPDTMPLDLKKVKCGGGERTVSAVPNQGSAAGDGTAVFAQWLLRPAAHVPAKSTRPGVQAVLFDLDGVLVDTARFHYLAWQQLAGELGLPFDERINEGFRGVGRMDCLDKLLGRHIRKIAASEKQVLAERKNSYYLDRVMQLRPDDLAPGARAFAAELKANGVRMAVVSASRNARLVLDLLGIAAWFDVIVDGTMVARSKPDPEGFLLAARKVRAEPDQCVVIEDAEAGIKAGQTAGMLCFGIGPTSHGANVAVADVAALTLERLDRAWREAGEE